MSFLGPKKSYLGIDLGSSAIKMVELQDKNGRAQLSTYGYVEQSTDIVRASSDEMEKKIVDILKSIHSKSRMTSKRAIAALPSFAVFSSIINLPAMNKKDMGQAIRWEAKKFVPLPIEEMTLDWKMVPDDASAPVIKKPKKEKRKNRKEKSFETEIKEVTKELGKESNPSALESANLEAVVEEKKTKASIFDKFSKGSLFGKKEDGEEKGKEDKGRKSSLKKGSKNQKILLTAAPKKLVERYIRIFKNAHLELASLETESFALERSLIGGDPSPVMIIDIGAISTDVTIIENSIPILTRSIDVGGTAFTKAVMTSLNVDINRAEQFKRDIGFTSAGPGDLPDIIKQTINPIVNEVKYSLDIFQSQRSTVR